jgi:hypothetical protein
MLNPSEWSVGWVARGPWAETVKNYLTSLKKSILKYGHGPGGLKAGEMGLRMFFAQVMASGDRSRRLQVAAATFDVVVVSLPRSGTKKSRSTLSIEQIRARQPRIARYLKVLAALNPILYVFCVL